MKLFPTLAVSALALAAAAPAFAGGLAAPVVEPVVTPVVVAPVITSDWTGAYVGASLGYSDLSVSQGTFFDGDTDTLDLADGYNYGVHGGYLYDLGSYVLGGELSYSRVTFTDNGDGTDLAEDVDANVIALKARAGYDAGSILPYVTVGYFAAEFPDAAAGSGGDFSDNDGIVYGLGLDYAVTNNVLIGAEYLRHDFNQFGGNDVDPDGNDISLDLDTISIRASYQF